MSRYSNKGSLQWQAAVQGGSFLSSAIGALWSTLSPREKKELREYLSAAQRSNSTNVYIPKQEAYLNREIRLPVSNNNNNLNMGSSSLRKVKSRPFIKRKVVVGRRPESLFRLFTTPFSYNTRCINEVETNRGFCLLPNIYSNFVTPPNASNAAPLLHHALPCIVFDLNWTPTGSADTMPSSANVRTLMASMTNSGGTNGTNSLDRYYFRSGVYRKTGTFGTDLNPASGNAEATTSPNYFLDNSTFNTLVFPAQSHELSTAVNDVSNTQNVMHDEVIMKLCMYGQNNLDTAFRVDIFQVNDEFAKYMNEVTTTSTFSTTNEGITKETWNNTWDALIRPYTQNPDLKQSPPPGMINFKRSFFYKIPEQSSFKDAMPGLRATIRLKIGKMLNRFWRDDLGAPNYAEDEGELVDANDDQAVADTNEADGFLHPSRRLYCMIRATNNEASRGVSDKGGDGTATDTNATAMGYYVMSSAGKDPTFNIQIWNKFRAYKV